MIFPEGDVYRDGTTHSFKTGAAKLALSCQSAGLNIPLIPMSINYTDDGTIARVLIGQSVELSPYVEHSALDGKKAIRTLTDRLHREVCHLRATLGGAGDSISLFVGRPRKDWAS